MKKRCQIYSNGLLNNSTFSTIHKSVHMCPISMVRFYCMAFGLVHSIMLKSGHKELKSLNAFSGTTIISFLIPVT